MAWPKNVTKADLIIQPYKGSGPGGQNRNKNATAIRITHKPTGLSACAENSKSQVQNKRAAFRRLAELLVPMMKREAQKARYAAGFERIRTYHLPEQRVTDVRVPDEQWRYGDVLSGESLDNLIRAVKKEER